MVDSEVSGGKKLLLTYTVPAGEGSKCRAVKAAIEDFMVSQSTSRRRRRFALQLRRRFPSCRCHLLLAL